MLSLVFYSPPHHHDHDHYHNHDHHQKHDHQADDDDQVTSARRPTSPTQSTLSSLESSRTGPSPPGERRVWPSKRSSSSSSSSPSSWILLQVNTALAFMVPAIGLILLPTLATPKNQVIVIMRFIIVSESFSHFVFQVWCVLLLAASWAFNGSANAGHVQNIIGLAPNRWCWCRRLPSYAFCIKLSRAIN